MNTALAVGGNGPTAPARVQLGGAAAMQQTIDDLNTIRAFVANEMKPGLDYGAIPGTERKDKNGREVPGKPTLLQPGAQKIFMYFNCYPQHDVEARELDAGHVEYIVKTALLSRASQQRIGSGLGSCCTMESKYRWRNAERTCPKCGQATVHKSKDEGQGFYCWRKKGGCGATFAESHPDIVGQKVGRAENPDIYDQRNTVLKMAKKRSEVDAAHGLGCMSELFTQDLEDFRDMAPPAEDRGEPERDHRRQEINRAFTPRDDRPQPLPRDEPDEAPPAKRVESWAAYVARTVKTTNDDWLAECAIEGVDEAKRENLITQYSVMNTVCTRAIEAKLIKEADVAKDGKPEARDQSKAVKAVSDLFGLKPNAVRKTVEKYIATKKAETRAALGMFDPDAQTDDAGTQDAAEEASQEGGEVVSGDR